MLINNINLENYEKNHRSSYFSMISMIVIKRFIIYNSLKFKFVTNKLSKIKLNMLFNKKITLHIRKISIKYEFLSIISPLTLDLYCMQF
jgi:hypothetical protein